MKMIELKLMALEICSKFRNEGFGVDFLCDPNDSNDSSFIWIFVKGGDRQVLCNLIENLPNALVKVLSDVGVPCKFNLLEPDNDRVWLTFDVRDSEQVMVSFYHAED